MTPEAMRAIMRQEVRAILSGDTLGSTRTCKTEWAVLTLQYPWIDELSDPDQITVRKTLEWCSSRAAVDMAEALRGEKPVQPLARITKFSPGVHFHALGLRFDSFVHAREYVILHGYRPGRLKVIDALGLG